MSINVAAAAETDGLIGEKFCAALKPGSIVVNTSRGSVVDPNALRDVIRGKGIRAGLDVYANEPPGGEGTFEDPIIDEPCVYGTHHIGASTDQAQQAIASEAVRIIDTYQTMGAVPRPGCVKWSWLQSSSSRFSTGVPVIATRKRPGSRNAARAD